MKYKIKHFLLLFVSAAGLSSCKTDSLVLPALNHPASAKTSTLELVSRLPADQRIQSSEMLAWYTANLQSSKLHPRWDLARQMVYHGRHVIELPTSADAALFFTKTNGVLNVDGYKWLVQTPGTKLYTGNVLYYNFQTRKLTASVYRQGKLTKTGVKDLPVDSGITIADKLLLSGTWTFDKDIKLIR